MDHGVESGPESGENRVNRGGSWNTNGRNCRAANRNRNTPSNRNNNLGFRLVSTARFRTVRSHPWIPAPCKAGDEQSGEIAASKHVYAQRGVSCRVFSRNVEVGGYYTRVHAPMTNNGRAHVLGPYGGLVRMAECRSRF
ncbi:MAG: hypothetical protein ACI87O_003138 [Planctomycetota bacterium]|jgi:hypothetical protein